MNFDTVIGIEIHVELKTKSKMFSTSANSFGQVPNSLVSPLDLGFPGTLPLLNKEAVRLAILACHGLNLKIDRQLYFDRKNYFYPDLPKGYQITQNNRPIGKNGFVEIIKADGTKKKITIERLHLEEDTAKQIHLANSTLLDYNRCGIPLAEIVSDPVIFDSQEACLYVIKLHDILLYLGVSDVKMEEGSMRCDINVSLKEEGSQILGTKVEIKNLNSLNNIQLALDYEIARQKEILEKGEKVEQETRRFSELEKKTISMRKKSDAVDYKYYTEANILPVTLKEEYLKEVLSNIPMLKEEREKKYLELNLPNNQIQIILNDVSLSDFYNEMLKKEVNPLSMANFLLGDILTYLNKTNTLISDLKVSKANIALLLKIHLEGVISTTQRTLLFNKLLEKDRNPLELANELGMVQNSDEDFIKNIVEEVLKENPEAINQYKAGKTNILAFLVGQSMKKSKGKANPQIVSKLFMEAINE